MPVDLGFELSYILSELLSRDVRVLGYTYEASKAALCVEVEVSGKRVKTCVEVKQCRGLETPRLERCLSKAFATQNKLAETLANSIRRELGD